MNQEPLSFAANCFRNFAPLGLMTTWPYDCPGFARK